MAGVNVLCAFFSPSRRVVGVAEVPMRAAYDIYDGTLPYLKERGEVIVYQGRHADYADWRQLVTLMMRRAKARRLLYAIS